MTAFRVEMLPAGEGDALWVEYGDDAAPSRMLVDGGVFATHEALLDRVRAGQRRFELIVVTHVDNDHIDALVKLLGADFGIEAADFWFNGYRQLLRDPPPRDKLGPKQGEMLTTRIGLRKLPHNTRFGGGSVVVPEDPDAALPTKDFAGMTLTLLGPRWEDLDELRPEWERVVEAAGLEPGSAYTGAKLLADQKKYRAPDALGKPPPLRTWADRPFRDDGSKPNRSSISFLAEYGGKSVLFTGDATSGTLVAGIDRLLRSRGGARRLVVTAVKLPHHGSKNNVSRELVERLACRHWLVSTNGNRHDHPDDDAIARVILGSKDPVLWFNYTSDDNRHWADPAWQRKHGYSTVYPPDGREGLVVDVLGLD